MSYKFSFFDVKDINNAVAVIAASLASYLAEFTIILLSLSALIILCTWAIRRKIQVNLEQTVGLPTVLWRPKFLNYFPVKQTVNVNSAISMQEEAKMSSSSITNMLVRMERLNGPYGMYATVYGLKTKVIHIAHPVPAKAILQNFSLKSPGYDHFKNFSGEGVFTADGEDWRRKRSSVVHALFKQQQRTKVNSDVSHAPSFADQLERESNEAASEFLSALFDSTDGIKPKNIVPLLQCAMVRIIYRYLTHDKSDDPIKNEQLSNDGAPNQGENVSTLLPAYLQSIIQIRMIILAQARSFWFLLPRIFYTMFSPMYIAEEQAMGPIRSFARMACRNANAGSPIHFLKNASSHCLKKDEMPINVANGKSEEEVPISKALLDEAITLLFAGQDTTAATLSWTLHLLSLHPEIQEKVESEVRSVLLQETPTIEQCYVSKKAVSRMVYLDAVVKESMRLYPVAPFVVRNINADTAIPDTKVILPKSSFACIWIYGLHRNPNLWSYPDRFLPERWLPENASIYKDEGITNGAYMPFASGPRMCVGQPLATIVLRIMLARIVTECILVDEDLRSSGKSAFELRKDMQAGFTVLPAGGVWLTGVRRI